MSNAKIMGRSNSIFKHSPTELIIVYLLKRGII